MPSAGDTFWFLGAGSPKPHLYIVLSDRMPCGNHIVVNITSCKPGDKNLVIDIPAKEPILQCGWKTTNRSTIHQEIILLPSKAIDAAMALKTARPSKVTVEWMKKCRKAACQIKCGGHELNAINRYYDSWK